METKGKIHSLESFGTVDGPGIRFVVFMQGCPLRCLYCHNPDTWDPEASTPYSFTPAGLMEEVLRYKNFIAKGGVTVTGGEPLMQAEFVTGFFKLCRENGIHTALDTSGAILNDKVKEVYQYTDLVLLDIKTALPSLHKELTGIAHTNPVRTLDYLEEKQIPVWIRHVVVPGYTDTEEGIRALATFLKPYTVIRKTELLPYHIMGTPKYEKMGMDYKLKKVAPLSAGRLEALKKLLEQ
ncbi:MAG: pyruvate formate lyase-activating protein [Tannerellaceae bacterium]|nr:pyruvate formate lyase-activating protein [Tannerellaceae bacterium]